MSDTQAPPDQIKHNAVNRYEQQIAGIPDSFDSLDAKAIRQEATVITDHSNSPWAAAADRVIRAYFEMLATWLDALDQLDSEIRGDVVEGGIPEWARQYLKAEARELFDAQQTLYRAIAEYHHGTAGPLLDPEYGYAYQLSNSALSPF